MLKNIFTDKNTFFIASIMLLALPATTMLANEKGSFYGGYYKSDERGNSTENFSSRGAQLILSAVKSRFKTNEDIFLNAQLLNRGSYPITLYMHRNYLLNFTLVVRDESGRSLPMQDVFYFKNTRDDQDTFFQNYTATNHHSRAMVLQPGESLNRQLRLQDIVKIDNIFDKADSNLNELQIEAFIYFNPEQNKNEFLKSQNLLRIFLEKRSFENNFYPDKNQVDAGDFEVTPQETVFLALSAEYTGNWPNYFKYVDLNSFIKDYPEYARLYANAEGFEKGKVIATFKDYLSDRRSHKLTKFKIVNDQNLDMATHRINRQRGLAEVQVNATRWVEGFLREFRYTYYLTKSMHNNSMWLITGMETQVIK